MFEEVAIYSMREKIPLQKIVITGWVGRGIFLLWARLWLCTLVLRSAVCLLSATNTFTKAALSMWTTHCSLRCPQGILKKCREKQCLDKKSFWRSKAYKPVAPRVTCSCTDSSLLRASRTASQVQLRHCQGMYLDTTQPNRDLTVKL